MFAITALITAILATTISAAPLATFQDFQITDTSIQKVLGGNVTIQFTVYDPDPDANVSQVCGGSWVTGSKGYPTGPYQYCGNSTFGWNMAQFDSVESYTLDLIHSFEDPSIGDPPYDWITMYAKANVSQAVTSCTRKGKKKTCTQNEDTVIQASIYASSAKRR